MFIWKVSTILGKIKELMPKMYKGLQLIDEAYGTDEQEMVKTHEFNNFEAISIDYGILEKSTDIYTIPGTFGWDDVGSWLAVGRIRTTNEYGNVVSGNIITINTNDCIIEGSRKLIATVGLKNLIVVDTEDATLICEKDSANDIKKVLETLKNCNRDEYI